MGNHVCFACLASSPKRWKNGPPLNKDEVLTLIIMARMEVEETFNYNWSATSFAIFLGFKKKLPPFLAYFWKI
jgi:hypothetical protein